jgi:6-phosphogluconate dehydrogenase (decarboxylating)
MISINSCSDRRVKGDLIIDAGTSYFQDTDLRARNLASRQRDRRVVAGSHCHIAPKRTWFEELRRPCVGFWRWTITAAIDEAVPALVLSTALYDRFSWRGDSDFANRVLSAMRKQLGGHDEKKKGKKLR